MARAPRRTCTKPGCFATTEAGKSRCPRHPVQPRQRERDEWDKQYDERRGTAASRGYDRRWYRLRNQFIAENPLCKECLEKGIVRAADEVDHIIPIKVAPHLRLVKSNLQSLCKSCHAIKTWADSLSRS